MTHSLSAIARRLAFIRETEGPNRGAWVEGLQRFADGEPGDSWCADFVSFVLDIAYHGRRMLPRSGATIRLLDAAKAKGWLVPTPAVDDLYFFVHADGRPHHVGIVTGIDPLTGIAGNTSADGLSSNGIGVFEHVLPHAGILFVRVPK